MCIYIIYIYILHFIAIYASTTITLITCTAHLLPLQIQHLFQATPPRAVAHADGFQLPDLALHRDWGEACEEQFVHVHDAVPQAGMMRKNMWK